ncbi:aspartate 1-decarboxylase [Sedimentisphaera salicampi]|uniref:Aspartate 1-decarboxylase n=1 Tax=Sedimentisphaera salicampi TaxID=1941349 RepID=A0A1W6LPS1_9BACT|nr:aspartate 1-decarboxylase [Sedimentisphaera salicampi]ARN57756.1 Aspartate 1-decarboxylase precursor [Sedimentisphaera salicampi]OXU14314.1 Aspartate 1-decarboxylase precursor [Sedimentisphaera salicampi]
MFVKALKAKIHRAKITDSQLTYPGSIGIDSDLLEASGIAANEAVLVANVNNGERIETYVVPEPAGSGKITILGAAARKFEPEDVVIIISFGFYSPEEMRTHNPRVVLADQNNGIKETR